MTAQKSTSPDSYDKAFSLINPIDIPWVDALRRSAFKKFQELGLPTQRRGNEPWKYTDIRKLAKHEFQPVLEHKTVSDQVVRDHSIIAGPSHLAVFIDGTFSPSHSSVNDLPKGANFSSLASAFHSQDILVEDKISRYSGYKAEAFTALNTAFIEDGAIITLTAGTVVKAPIHLLFITTSHKHEVAIHPRIFVHLEESSSASIIESHTGIQGNVYLSNAVAELLIDSNARLNYYKLQRHPTNAFHITNTEAIVNRDGYFSCVNIDLGGDIVRNNLNTRMAGEGASTKLNGLYLTTDKQHVDNQVIIEHIKGNTRARELYKGILDGQSRSVFHGSIIVREGASGVDAYQVDKNLLLSNQAEADTKPAFWVYTDDVKCGHGAACGQIDDDAVFYLRSRGLDEITARQLLIHGFIAEVIDSIENPDLRDHVSDLVHSKLEQWLLV
ncbi:MAG: Fe-S cluster assembly protein SufD [Chloroflexi bacterium]|jgi:Fe-S cluster assembly protein SufD|nr:MAG: Fe-S cluster assembly protein SufD [Chloroflexota bacterium]